MAERNISERAVEDVMRRPIGGGPEPGARPDTICYRGQSSEHPGVILKVVVDSADTNRVVSVMSEGEPT
jgi:hypothetical protein